MTTCYINGKYKPLNQSYVSVTDRGFQFSDGVYEVISVFKGELVDLNLHINRLFVSLKKMNMKTKFNRNQKDRKIADRLAKYIMWQVMVAYLGEV